MSFSPKVQNETYIYQLSLPPLKIESSENVVKRIIINIEEPAITLTLPPATLKVAQLPKPQTPPLPIPSVQTPVFAPSTPLNQPSAYNPMPLSPMSSASSRSPKEIAILGDFRTRISQKIPKQVEAQAILYPANSPQKEDMNKVSIGNNHYIASAWWWGSWGAEKFWEIIALNRPAAVVKLVNDEMGTYWPKEEGQSLKTNPEKLRVTCIKKEEITSGLTLRIIEVATANETFKIPHINFNGWPDFGVPNMETFKKVLATVNAQCPETTPEKRLFVHCMGGMGRTGTFIAAHAGTHAAVDQQTNDLFHNIIMDMRTQRPKPMVERDEQYLFLHKLINQA